MTVVEVSSNGNSGLSTRERVRQARDELGGNPKGTEVAALLEIPATTANYHLRALAGEGKGVLGSEPVRVADGTTRSTPPARPKPAVTKVAARVKPADRHWVETAVIWLVGAAVALWSFTHIVDLAFMAGIGWRSWLAPIALDGLTIVAIRAWRRRDHRLVAAAGIAAGLVGSVAANVVALRPELVNLADVRAVLAAYPPIALAVIVHLVRR